MHLAAATALRVPAGKLAAQARERFGGDLRRAGAFAQLSLLGAQACLDAAPAGRALGVLWSSSRGPLGAVRTALAEAARGEPVMPFGFVAIQPHLAATLLAQRGVPVSRAAFVRVADGGWPWLLWQAQAWLRSCDQVLLGWVEEAVEADGLHQSDWCALQAAPGVASLEPLPDTTGAVPAQAGTWLAKVAAWLASPRAPLALRSGDEAWRFAAASGRPTSA